MIRSILKASTRHSFLRPLKFSRYFAGIDPGISLNIPGVSDNQQAKTVF